MTSPTIMPGEPQKASPTAVRLFAQAPTAAKAAAAWALVEEIRGDAWTSDMIERLEHAGRRPAIRTATLDDGRDLSTLVGDLLVALRGIKDDDIPFPLSSDDEIPF